MGWNRYGYSYGGGWPEYVPVAARIERAVRGNAAHALADDDLAGIFGIELAGGEPPAPARPAARAKRPAKPKPKPKPTRTKQKPKPKPAGRKPAKCSGRRPPPPVTE